MVLLEVFELIFAMLDVLVIELTADAALSRAEHVLVKLVHIRQHWLDGFFMLCVETAPRHLQTATQGSCQGPSGLSRT